MITISLLFVMYSTLPGGSPSTLVVVVVLVTVRVVNEANGNYSRIQRAMNS